LAARVGVSNFYCTMNVDPLSIRALQGSPRERTMLCDLVRRLEDRQIRFFGSFALGRDWDDNSIAERILALCIQSNHNSCHIDDWEKPFSIPEPGWEEQVGLRYASVSSYQGHNPGG
jgi:hypothetical protein